MPLIGELTAKQIESVFSDFESGFHRSRRGNLWREFEGSNVTVFKSKYGAFAWCISSGDDDVEFSPENFATEREAIDSVAVELLKR